MLIYKTEKYLNTVCWNIYVCVMFKGITVPCLSVLQSIFLQLLADWASRNRKETPFLLTQFQSLVSSLRCISSVSLPSYPKTSATTKNFLWMQTFLHYLRPKGLKCLTHFQISKHGASVIFGTFSLSTEQKV